MGVALKHATVEFAIELEIITCCNQTCGMTFAAPIDWVKARQKSHTTFYCPNGHGQSYNAASEEERLRKELAAAKGDAHYYQERLTATTEEARRLERSRSALRGVVTRMRNKAVQGECAFCSEQFSDLAGHVAQAHPDVDPNQIDDEATA